MSSKRVTTLCLSVLMTLSTFAVNNEGVQDTASKLLGGTFAFGTIILFVIFYLIWYIFVAVMAQNRNRNVALWILFSLLGTPWLMIIILFCIGKDESGNKR